MSVSDHIAELFKLDITQAIKDIIGSDDCDAESMAAAIMTRIQKRWGTREIYIPAVNCNERNASIKREFNGRNHAEICNRYRISLATLYRIIKQ